MARIVGRVNAARASKAALRADNAALQRAGFANPQRKDGAAEAPRPATIFTADSFQNLALKLGLGADNALSQSTYGYYPVTRIRVLLEWIHRGSWLGGIAVDTVADDMTRAGIEITSTMDPKDVRKLDQAMIRLGCWNAINETIKWGRLYGGAVGFWLIDGQDPLTPLRVDTITKGQFKGILVFDRWMLNPSVNQLVYHPLWGMVPEFYDTMAGWAMGVPRIKFHHTRCFRMEGIRLPWQQRLAENMWGLSVIERMYDRMVAFDSGTMGVAQSLYKSFLRYMKITDFKSIASTGGAALTGLAKYLHMIAKYQSVEGLTIIDAGDDFGTHQNQTFSGMSEGLLQLGQQLAGALQIPLVRLFGQSPAGLNATGESDLRLYYDGINSQQERTERNPVDTTLRIAAKSEGVKIPDDFDFRFRTLWQATEKEKAETAEIVERTVGDAYANSMISQRVAMEELQQASHDTGIFTNITPDDIEAAESLIPTSLGGVNPETGELEQPIDIGEDEDAGDTSKSNGTSRNGAGAKGKGKSQSAKRGAGASRSKSNGKDNGRATADSLPLTVLGHRTFQDILCVVDHPPDIDRKGRPSPGACAYGHIARTTGMDSENIDCLFGPNESAFMVWGINQGEHDPEHKICFGFDKWSDALAAYQALYPDYPPPTNVVGMPIGEFKEWLSLPENHGKPLFRPSRIAA